MEILKKFKKPIIIAAVIIIVVIIIGIILSKKANSNDYQLEKIDKYSYFKIYQNEKYGVIDASGKILIEPSYQIINIPNPTRALFVCYYDYNESTGEFKTKVLNDRNEEILTEYEQVLPIMCDASTSNIPFEKSVLKYKENDKYGLIDFVGNKITKANYDEIESLEYREGTLKVKQDDKYGLINIRGKQIIKSIYDDIKSDEYYMQQKDYMEAGFVVQTKTEEGYRYGYINKNGKEIVKTDYNEIDRITEIEGDNIYLLVSKNGKYGVLKNSQTVLENIYEEIEYNKTNNVFIVQKGSKQGVLSADGKEILPIEYDYILCSGNKITTRKGEGIEIYNNKGERQDSRYDNTIETSNENYLIVIDNNNKFGVASKNENMLIPNEYENIEYAFEDYFIATQNGKVGIINVNSGVVVNFEYDIIQKVKEKNILQAIISNTNTIDIYNINIEKQISINDAVLYSYDNYIKLIAKNNMQYFDNNGNIISNKKIFTKNKLFACIQDDKWGFADINNNIVVEPKYDMVTEFNQYGYAGIKKDGKWGVVNESGKVIVEPSYNIDWNEPEFINKYCKLNFGYGFEYYTDELTDKN